MQVILLEYPGVQGEVTLTDWKDWISVSSVSMSTSSDGDTGSPSFGDEADPGTRFAGIAGAVIESQRQQRTGTTTPKARAGNRVGIDSLTITRTADKATPKFLQLAFKERVDGDSCTINVFRAQDNTKPGASANTQVSWHEPFLQLQLYDVHISSHELSITEGELTETLTISFKELDMHYLVFKNGRNVGNVSAHVDLTGEQE